MGFWKKYIAKLYSKQWNIGLCKGDLAQMIRDKKSDLSFKWFPLQEKSRSLADPFVFTGKDGRVNVFCEDFSTDKLDGRIALIEFNEALEPISSKNVLVTDKHLSYPFVYSDDEVVWVIPENAFTGSVYGYKWNETTSALTDKKQLLDFPLIDPTIVKHNEKYWLFGTKLGADKSQDRNLHIFYSDKITGPFLPHRKNPVKSTLDGARPAGGFILVDGNLYRQAQNSGNYYGESIAINRVNTLTEELFEEELYFKIGPDKKSKYDKGIHTINTAGGVIIADGLRFFFDPLGQLRRRLKKSK